MNVRCTSRAVPRIYFEEWDEPMISGVAWVSELIEAAAGSSTCFRDSPHAKYQGSDRIA